MPADTEKEAVPPSVCCWHWRYYAFYVQSEEEALGKGCLE